MIRKKNKEKELNKRMYKFLNNEIEVVTKFNGIDRGTLIDWDMKTLTIQKEIYKEPLVLQLRTFDVSLINHISLLTNKKIDGERLSLSFPFSIA